MPGPALLDLPGPSRRIRVEPLRVPEPSRTSEPAPAERDPAPAEPVPAEPAHEPAAA